MKIKDVVESKNKQELPQSKPRNFVAKNAMSTTSGAGAHRDKKREQKQGYEKHKGKEFAEDSLNEGTRLIGRHEAGNKSVAVYRDTDWGEFIVRFYVDDEWDEDSDYHTDDKQDAFDTAKHWLSKAMPSQHGLDETGEVTGTIAAVSSDGKQVTVKNKDGSTTQTTAAAFAPGPNNTVTMKHDAAGDTLKPGATVTSDQNVSEEGDDEVFAIAPDGDHIHPETDDDLIGSGHNIDVGGDPTDDFIDQVVDKDFERAQRGREGLAGRSKRLGENDELAKMLTIAGLR